MTKKASAMPTHLIASGKGGVGKTLKLVMTAYGLAVEIIEAMLTNPAAGNDHKILVIDLDAQAAATRRLAAPSPQGKTMAEVLDQSSDVTLKDIIVPCGWTDEITNGRIFVAPASVGLTVRDKESHLPGADRRLVKHILDVMDEYQYILIDLPSGITHLMAIASVVSDGWIGATQPEIDAINELARVHHTLTTEWKDYDICPQIEMIGVTANLIDPNPKVQLHADGLALIKANYGDSYWADTDVKRMIRLAEMNSHALPPHQLPNLTGNEHDYILGKCTALAKRVMAHG